MPIVLDGHMVYTPKEAAEFLTRLSGRKITVGDLRQLRLKGRVNGMRLGYNETVFTEEQLRAADLQRHTPGRPKKRTVSLSQGSIPPFTSGGAR